MKLSDIKPGEKAVICHIPDRSMRMQVIRFGLNEGAVVTCLEKLRQGPLVIAIGRQELAVGRGLADLILVKNNIEGALKEVS